MKQKEKVFIELIKEYEGLIFKASTIYTNNKQDQKDLFQEIVYQLWKSFDSFKNQAKISTWMYRVAMNTAITQLKRSKNHLHLNPLKRLFLSKWKLMMLLLKKI